MRNALNAAADFDALPKIMPHISPLVNRLSFQTALQIPSKNKKTPLRDIFMDEIIALRCFEPVKYHSRISEICAIFNH